MTPKFPIIASNCMKHLNIKWFKIFIKNWANNRFVSKKVTKNQRPKNIRILLLDSIHRIVWEMYSKKQGIHRKIGLNNNWIAVNPRKPLNNF